jgi:RNA polymerase sigma-70 factor (ECF subfamily)
MWDRALPIKGEALLERSATGADLTPYHVEAAIASEHARAPRSEDTNWRNIVSLYDTLMRIAPSPVVALNRAIALAQLEGPEPGLAAIHAIPDRDRLVAYPFYEAALGELELRNGRSEIARDHFRAALALARNAMERRFLEQRVRACVDRSASMLR